MGTDRVDHTEIEWQFTAADLVTVRRWLESGEAPGYALRGEGTQRLSDTYYDTEDWRLYRAGLTCRTREKGGGCELTLKSMADAKDGMRSRRELNERIESGAVEAMLAAPGPCGEAIRAVAGTRAVRPLFRIETERERFVLSDEEGDLGEVALDSTRIIAGEEEPSELSRLEVEVGAGAVERARGFVDLLLAKGGLSAAGPSKFQAGLAAMGVELGVAPPDFGPTTISAGMSAAEVAYAVLRRQFAAFLKNEPGTRLGHDIEALHDMRVAARRMRAALSLFREHLPGQMQEFRADLAWVAQALGDVRDLDVQRGRVEEWQAELPERDRTALRALEARIENERREARGRTLEVLDDRRYEALVQGFGAALRKGPGPGEGQEAPIVEAAPRLLGRPYRRLRRLGDSITKGSPAAEYHRLRIEAKRLRYAVEFVAEIYGKPARGFSARVTALQDVLGLHQDGEVAAERLWAMAVEPGAGLPPETVFVMGRIAERYQRLGEEQREAFPRAYSGLKGKAWKELRQAVAGKRPAKGRRAGQ